MKYSKAPLDYCQILSLLKSRGLLIKDKDIAINHLKVISYFRFANYLTPMECDKILHVYKPNSYFENAIRLYYFDKELRGIIFDAIQSIEIALRSKITNFVSLKYGTFWFMEPTLFKDNIIFNQCLSLVKNEILRSKEDFISEHYKKYTGPDFPPAWKTIEVISFGTLSKILSNLKDSSIKKLIAREFNLPQHLVLENWVKCLVNLRNCIAHHARVWNRNFPAIPQFNISLRGKWVSNFNVNHVKLYPQLCLIEYFIQNIHVECRFKEKLIELLDKNPTIDINAMGFPKNWKNEALWLN
ncbi:MAG: Abi family protein [Paludibacteraceae bacterium]|nr:Abi family protein [Paludibacteraceae bacterium]